MTAASHVCLPALTPLHCTGLLTPSPLASAAWRQGPWHLSFRYRILSPVSVDTYKWERCVFLLILSHCRIMSSPLYFCLPMVAFLRMLSPCRSPCRSAPSPSTGSGSRCLRYLQLSWCWAWWRRCRCCGSTGAFWRARCRMTRAQGSRCWTVTCRCVVVSTHVSLSLRVHCLCIPPCAWLSSPSFSILHHFLCGCGRVELEG